VTLTKPIGFLLFWVFLFVVGAVCHGAVAAQANTGTTSTYSHSVSIDERVSSVESDILKISDKINASYIDIFTKVIALFATVFSITVAITAIIGNMVVKDYMGSLHKSLLDETQRKLDEKISRFSKEIEQETAIAVSKAESKIYTTFAAHCLNLYKDISNPDEPSRRRIYESYLDIAVVMAFNGYAAAQQLKKHVGDKVAAKDHEDIFVKSLNNYAYFLAERSGQTSQRAENDRVKLGELLKHLHEAYECHEYSPTWWSYKDTIIWVELHLGRMSPEDASRQLTEMLADGRVPNDWKHRARQRYKFYNSLAQNGSRLVNLPN
jgi:hypothetical protein